MSSCPNCGHVDAEDHDFCKSCGTYLRWEEAPEQSDTAVLEAVVLPPETLASFEEPPRAPSPPDPPAIRAPEPAQQAVRGDAANVTLRLPEDASSAGGPVTAAVDAGGAVELIATVRNESGVVDYYDLRITGIPEGWWTIAPPVVYLVPFGAESGSYEQEVTVRLHPPRRPEAEAGLWPIRLVATSRARATEAHSAVVGLMIAPYEELESRVAPERGHGESSARYAVPVRSGGNAWLAVSFQGEDPDWEMSFAFDPPALWLPPGGEGMSTVTVSAERLTTGAERERKFTVYAKGGEQALAGTASFVQLPVVQRPVVQWPPITGDRLVRWRIAVTLLAAAMLIGGSFMNWSDGLKGVCVEQDPSVCLRADYYLNLVAPDVISPAGSNFPAVLNLVTSLGFLTIVLGVLVLLGIRTGTGAWPVGAVAVVALVVFLFTLRGQAGSGAGAWVVLLGGILAMAAGALKTASAYSDRSV